MVSLTNASIITLKQSLGFILGAGIGTTITRASIQRDAAWCQAASPYSGM
ncbi:hypothetical protein [Desulfotruncus alcoholivorax]|nr:hypothetical protein [Desulfotruncus alcoholivorax]